MGSACRLRQSQFVTMALCGMVVCSISFFDKYDATQPFGISCLMLVLLIFLSFQKWSVLNFQPSNLSAIIPYNNSAGIVKSFVKVKISSESPFSARK